MTKKKTCSTFYFETCAENHIHKKYEIIVDRFKLALVNYEMMVIYNYICDGDNNSLYLFHFTN